MLPLNRVQTPTFSNKIENKAKQANNKRQLFRVQCVKLSPNINNMQPKQDNNFELNQRVTDQSVQIKLLEKQLAESQKQNEVLEAKIKKANQTVCDYWKKVKDQEKFVQTTQQKFLHISNKYKDCREKKKMYKRRIIDALNYFYGRYTDAQQQNAPFIQLEELRQILLSLGMHESILEEMQQANQLVQNPQDVERMTYEQLLQLQERIGNHQVGLTKEQIKKIPKKAKQEEDEQIDICTICYEQLEIGQKYRTLPCTHLYHSKCIKAWLLNHKKCPVCNVEVEIE